MCVNLSEKKWLSFSLAGRLASSMSHDLRVTGTALEKKSRRTIQRCSSISWSASTPWPWARPFSLPAMQSILWQWCVVTKSGDQHVYHATAEEASNGSGGARIEGVKSLAQWLGAVTRKPHSAKRAPKDAEDAIDRARAIHGEIVEFVCARGLTQTSDGVKKNRAGVLNAWDDALDALEGLRTLDANAPDRTDRRPTPRVVE